MARILLIAEAANPEFVSVPLVGWSLASAISRQVDAHLVTQVRNKAALERAGLIEGKDFTAIDTEFIAAKVWWLLTLLRGDKGKAWTLVTAFNSLIYPIFEWMVWRQFREALQSGHYDLVHRITPLTPTANSYLSGKCRNLDIPFVMGPLNGGVPWPQGFDSERRREREWLSYVRGLYKLLPGRRSTLKNASAIIAGSKYTASEIPDEFQPKVSYIPENAVSPSRFPKPGAEMVLTDPLRICFIGRLVPYKGCDILIEALSPMLRNGQLSLLVIGDGPERKYLDGLCIGLDVQHAVRFAGWLSHAEIASAAAGCQIFGFPSVREFGGGAVLEAMAMGLVPVIADYAGPSELVDASCGFKVKMGTRDELVAGFRDIFERICVDPEPLVQLSARCIDEVYVKYTWEAKATQISELYDRLLK